MEKQFLAFFIHFESTAFHLPIKGRNSIVSYHTKELQAHFRYPSGYNIYYKYRYVYAATADRCK